MSIPSIREDFIFINDVSNAVVVASVNDTNLNVRIRSSWAVANLADALVAISEQDTESGLSQFAEAFFVELIRAGLSAAKDNEKVGILFAVFVLIFKQSFTNNHFNDSVAPMVSVLWEVFYE